jgi:AcrR family transcriptional regulator
MATTVGPGRPLRADARRNQAQILTAARDVFIERGPDAPLDEIARRAGVGIGTLYRRFADRGALMRAVALDALTRTAEAAEHALAESDTAFDALVRYLHTALDLRVSAVIPTLLDRIDLEDDEIGAVRSASSAAIERIVQAAHAEGSLAAEVTIGDVGLVLVRMARPLPGPIPAELDLELGHRHLDLIVAGLRAEAPMSGPSLTFEDLRALQDRPEPDQRQDSPDRREQ